MKLSMNLKEGRMTNDRLEVYMIQKLHKEIDNWRAEYIHLGQELGEIINEQQNIILKLQNANRRLKRENWNLKRTKGRKK